MERKIKLRAWDDKQKYMAYQGTPDLETLQSFIFHFGNDKLMQCSPFSDKNGKEIYEGDFLGDWTEIDGKMEQSKLQVYFDDMLGQWMIDCSLKQDRSLSYSLFKELEDFAYEVFGNIYENPEISMQKPSEISEAIDIAVHLMKGLKKETKKHTDGAENIRGKVSSDKGSSFA
ncbi:MAG: YopX family protein [Bacteroidota bacterium]|nr:YopX family protein [Bacteroidota bacterium]